MYKIFKILLVLVLFSSAISGCKNSEIGLKETFIRDTTYVFLPAPIIDSADATSVTDSIISVVRLRQKDTIVHIKYFPINNNFYWKIQPDTVKIRARDTLTSYTETLVIEKTSFWTKLGIFAAGFAVAICVWVFRRRIKKNDLI